jgi:hypothetical protein
MAPGQLRRCGKVQNVGGKVICVSHDRHVTYHAVLDATGGRECPICALVAEAVSSNIASLIRECVLDVRTREAIRASRGFCGEHTEQVIAAAPVLPLATLAEDLTRLALEDLPPPKGRWKPVKRSQCPVCVAREDAARRYVSALASHLKAALCREKYTSSKGLCAQHFEAVFEAASADGRAFLVEASRAHLERLRGELREVIRKCDYRFADEPWTDDERDAAVRGARRAVA